MSQPSFGVVTNRVLSLVKKGVISIEEARKELKRPGFFPGIPDKYPGISSIKIHFVDSKGHNSPNKES